MNRLLDLLKKAQLLATVILAFVKDEAIAKLLTLIRNNLKLVIVLVVLGVGGFVVFHFLQSSELLRLGEPSIKHISIEEDMATSSLSPIVHALKHAKQDEKIVLEVNTSGGDVMDSYVLYNAMATTKADLTVRVSGMAASAGGIILCFAKKIEIADYALVLFHAPRYTDKNGKVILVTDLKDPYAKTVLRSVTHILTNHCDKILSADDIKFIFKGNDFWLMGSDVKERLGLEVKTLPFIINR